MTENNTENQVRGVLFGTFVIGDEDAVQAAINKILETVQITNKYMFVLRDKDDESRTLLTYNAKADRTSIASLKLFTLRLHRKKQTNTLYTINGLNMAVSKQYNGKTGKHLKLDWDEYQNSVILTYNRNIKVMRADLQRILELEF
jgi:hypothetical protein